MVRSCLIRLRESMMVGLTGLIVPETADIRLKLRLFFNFDGNNLDLVIRETNFNLKHGRHNELISLNGVKIVFLLLFTTLSSWNMHLVLLPV
jgi:hypothetical protein